MKEDTNTDTSGKLKFLIPPLSEIKFFNASGIESSTKLNFENTKYVIQGAVIRGRSNVFFLKPEILKVVVNYRNFENNLFNLQQIEKQINFRAVFKFPFKSETWLSLLIF